MKNARLAVQLLICTVAMSISSGSQPVNRNSILLVANKGDHTLGIINAATGRQIATVPEQGTTGHEVAASPDGKLAYVPIYGNSGVGKPDFGHGVRPHCAVFGPKDGLLYVTTELDKTISVIDPHSLKIVGTIPTGQAESHMLAISPDGERG